MYNNYIIIINSKDIYQFYLIKKCRYNLKSLKREILDLIIFPIIFHKKNKK